MIPDRDSRAIGMPHACVSMFSGWGVGPPKHGPCHLHPTIPLHPSCNGALRRTHRGERQQSYLRRGPESDLGVTISPAANTAGTLVLLADGESGFQFVDDNSPTRAGRARVRLINASEDSVSLTIRDGGTTLFALVRFDEPGEYEYPDGDLVARTYDLTVVPLAGEMTPLEFNGIEFEAGSVYTLFAVGRIDGEGEAFDLIVEMDASPGEQPSGKQYRWRRGKPLAPRFGLLRHTNLSAASSRISA